MEICDFQKWTHLFDIKTPKVYKEEVRSFYADMFTVEGETICLKINEKEFMIDAVLLGEILGVPTEGLSTIERTCSSDFKKIIIKPRVVQMGEKVHKNTNCCLIW